jgi:EAL domain-containing protein (putative c-di-GMP-specific phosphodiesterase class I)
LGVAIAIDDFGTGYSSLGQLTRLPVDSIKIDRSFISQMATNRDEALIVRTIADLGRNLGLRVVAEGVEDELTWGLLAAMGCDSAQGYFVAPPLTGSEVGQWLEATPWAVKGAKA